jgi:proline-specific peptidase
MLRLTEPLLNGVVTLDDLIGDTSALQCQKGTLSLRGLSVAYWIYSNPTSAPKPPVIALHGGPSFTHHYMLPLKLLALTEGHPVVFYDQAGCGESSRAQAANPGENTPWLLTVEYYVEELRELVAHLGFTGFYVYGNSWGSMLALEFAVSVTREPMADARLLGLVLEGALCDGAFYIASQWRERISTLPSFTQRLLKQLEAERKYDCAAYHTLEHALNAHFVLRLVPHPDCWKDALSGLNREIYTAMQGASEFTFGGVLENWSITERLSVVDVPTLVMRGEYDTMTEEVHQLVVDSIRTAQPLITIARAGHCKLIDEPQACCEAVAKFLRGVEAAARAPH